MGGESRALENVRGWAAINCATWVQGYIRHATLDDTGDAVETMRVEPLVKPWLVQVRHRDSQQVTDYLDWSTIKPTTLHPLQSSRLHLNVNQPSSVHHQMSQVTLYSYPTPNGVSVSILLEELGIAYNPVRISVSDSDKGKIHNHVKSPWFLEISPNGRIPAITHDEFRVFETSAILLYLQAEFDNENKYGYSPVESPKEYSELLQWLFFAHGGVGPTQGQANHFNLYASEKIPYAQDRFLNELRNLYAVLESRLSKHEYLVGQKYTIADIKAFAWVRRAPILKIDLKEFPALKAWVDRIESRPAVQRGLTIPAETN